MKTNKRGWILCWSVCPVVSCQRRQEVGVQLPKVSKSLITIAEDLLGGQFKIKHDIDLWLMIWEKQYGKNLDLERTIFLQDDAIDRFIEIFANRLKTELLTDVPEAEYEEAVTHVSEKVLTSLVYVSVDAWKRLEGQLITKGG